MKNYKLSVTLSPSLLERVKEVCESKQATKTTIARLALIEYIEKNEKTTNN